MLSFSTESSSRTATPKAMIQHHFANVQPKHHIYQYSSKYVKDLIRLYEVTNIYFHCHGFIQYAWHIITKWQYYNQNDLYADILKYSNMGFTGMFSVETVLKIIAYGVKVSTQIHGSFW